MIAEMIPSLSISQYLFLAFLVYAPAEFILHLGHAIVWIRRALQGLPPEDKPAPLLFMAINKLWSYVGRAVAATQTEEDLKNESGMAMEHFRARAEGEQQTEH